jgi:ABC-type sugar transport system ATPase subunit
MVSPIATVNESTASGAPVLQMRAIRKSFGGGDVLKRVNFDVRAGEVHALCGENGAGKSTLMNILAGVVSPDAGEITLGTQTLSRFANAHAARRAGVSIVFQERSLFAPLTVAENIFAGRQPVTAWGMISRRRLFADAERVLRGIAPEVAPDAVVGELSPAQQQMVEIAKALSLEARVVIFDEPTAALTDAETTRLFNVIRHLRERGVGIVYISHRLEEIFAVADRVTVLKDGAWQGTLLVSQTSTDDLIRRMVGRDVETASAEAVASSNPVLLEVKGLCDPISQGNSGLLRDISLHVRAGEIVGLAGLAGAGRTETALALFGVRPIGGGEVRVDGRPVKIHSPSDAITAGLGYVSEDRKESGLFLDMSIRRNMSVARLDLFGRWFFCDAEERAIAEEYREKLRVICRDIEQDAGHLSGGNQQKVLLARWLLVQPRVLIVDEPTRGVDVGAKAEVHQLLRDFVRQGRAVLMISSDLPEVMTVSDRTYVMHAGRIAGELPRAVATEEAIMRLAAGKGFANDE